MTNVSVLPKPNQSAATGDPITYSVMPAKGYKILSEVTGTCPSGTWNDIKYTIASLTNDCTVEFKAIAVFSVGIRGENLSNNADVETTIGDSAKLVPQPAKGFTLLHTVAGTCPQGSWSGSQYTTGPITASCMTEFSTVPNRYFYAAISDSLTKKTTIKIAQYSINPETGALTLVSKIADSKKTGGADDIVLSLDSKSIYAVEGKCYAPNTGVCSVAQYSVDPETGALTEKSRVALPTTSDISHAMTLAGSSLYVTVNTSASDTTYIVQFSLSFREGKLGGGWGIQVKGGRSFQPLWIDPSRAIAYLFLSDLTSVNEYSIANGIGSLLPLNDHSNLKFGSQGGYPNQVTTTAISPDGRAIYFSSDSGFLKLPISNETGALSVVPTQDPKSQWAGPLIFTPNAKWGYGTNGSYSYDSATGKLTWLRGVEITVAGRSVFTPDSKWAYVLTNASDGTLAGYSIDSDGHPKAITLGITQTSGRMNAAVIR